MKCEDDKTQIITATESVCGLWVDASGKAHLCLGDETGKRREVTLELRPWCWASENPASSVQAKVLNGNGFYKHLVHFDDYTDYKAYIKDAHHEATIDYVRYPESQVLMQHQLRCYGSMQYRDLRRCQLDIETACGQEGGFSNPYRDNDRLLAVGLQFSGEKEPRLLCLEDATDAAEARLLEALCDALQEADPDVIEGHNIFNFDLHYLRVRSKKLGVKLRWGRFGAQAQFRQSRMRIAERWLDYLRCDVPGRTVFDSYLMLQVFDITARDLPSYGLKEAALAFGVTDASSKRVYLPGDQIQQCFDQDREAFLRYLADDLRETEGVVDVLMPTYMAQIKNYPMTLQEACLRGTAAKVDSIFLEKYYHAGESLSAPPQIKRFEGGFTRSFETGVFTKILHFDVASLYPSLLLLIGRNPKTDTLGIFIPMLKELRQERMRYKQLAKAAKTEEERREYGARQASFKILINSFYGYLGFGGAKWADSELAAEVTQRGRALLQSIIERIQKLDTTVLEADTDGIYVSAPDYWHQPEVLLEKIVDVLPEGIDLEYDGSYLSMFCYKAKNYALWDGQKVLIRGSALRSRGTEPFLKELSDALIHYKLGASDTNPMKLLEEMRSAIIAQKMPVERLAKSEYLSQKPQNYRKAVDDPKRKSTRRASLEVASRMNPQPRMGERVRYFITHGEKKRMPDWQVARALADFDPQECPYNPDYYCRKLDDWIKRYGDFLDTNQLELL